MMLREIDATNAAAYLRDAGRVPGDRAVIVQALGGGVSNVVLRVEPEGAGPFVLKQSRERLRTRAHWVSRLDRIWVERDALRLLADHLPPGAVPRVLFDDPENYLFAMTCAPEGSVPWKERLLAGDVDPNPARQAGAILGAMHARLAGPDALGRFADTEIFDQLRIDPYYRFTARAHPDLAGAFDDLIASMTTTADRTFVHADFSPKNLLHEPAGLMAVDFETAHAGDPAFDLGFFLSHLVLKAFRAAPAGADYLKLADEFLASYTATARPDADRLRRGSRHAAGCTLARVDGKSPVEYLDEPRRDAARRFARAALRDGVAGWADLADRAAREMPEAPGESGA